MRRKITAEIVGAFLKGEKKTSGNTATDGKTLYLHGNAIAQHRSDGLYISDGNYPLSSTTKERLSGIPNVQISIRKGQGYYNGKPWNGSWVLVPASITRS